MSPWSSPAASPTSTTPPTSPCAFRRPRSTACCTTAIQVALGGTILTAHLTAGHTKGTTTWTLDETENGRTLHVVIVGSPNVNPGYKLVDNKTYPQIADDYRHEFQVLKSLPCDIFLGAHGGYFGLAGEIRTLESRRPQCLHRSRRLQGLHRRSRAGLRVRASAVSHRAKARRYVIPQPGERSIPVKST